MCLPTSRNVVWYKQQRREVFNFNNVWRCDQGGRGRLPQNEYLGEFQIEVKTKDKTFLLPKIWEGVIAFRLPNS